MDANLPSESAKTKVLSSIKSPSPSLVEAALLIVAIGLFYWFIIQPKKTELANTQINLGKLQEDQTFLAANLQKLRNLVTQLKSSTTELGQLDESLPLDGKSLRV